MYQFNSLCTTRNSIKTKCVCTTTYSDSFYTCSNRTLSSNTHRWSSKYSAARFVAEIGAQLGCRSKIVAISHWTEWIFSFHVTIRTAIVLLIKHCSVDWLFFCVLNTFQCKQCTTLWKNDVFFLRTTYLVKRFKLFT